MNDFPYLVELAQGTRLHIAMDDSNVTIDASEEEACQAAKAFFDKYRDKNVVYAPRMPHPAFVETLYEYSSQEYAKEK